MHVYIVAATRFWRALMRASSKVAVMKGGFLVEPGFSYFFAF
jgi:hypothetical protein